MPAWCYIDTLRNTKGWRIGKGLKAPMDPAPTLAGGETAQELSGSCSAWARRVRQVK